MRTKLLWVQVSELRRLKAEAEAKLLVLQQAFALSPPYQRPEESISASVDVGKVDLDSSIELHGRVEQLEKERMDMLRRLEDLTACYTKAADTLAAERLAFRSVPIPQPWSARYFRLNVCFAFFLSHLRLCSLNV